MFLNLFLCTIVTLPVLNGYELGGDPIIQTTMEDKRYRIVESTMELKQKKENDDLKMCRFRDEGLFPKKYWNWKAGAECYRYNPPDWFNKKLRMIRQTVVLENITYVIPIGVAEDKQLIGFDYTSPEWSKIISDSFKDNLLYIKWRHCAVNAEICCSQVMNEQNIFGTEEYPCSATWDAWSCFLPATSNSVSELPCPDYTTSSSDTPCVLYSEKQCFANGTWNQQTDYGLCASAPVYRKRHKFHVIVLYVSIALCLPAVIIFMSYRNLRILRVNLHRNLLIACIIRNMLTIISKEVVLLDSLKPREESNNIMEENGVPCRILSFLNSVAANAIFSCMLLDGFYLHKLIVRIFSADPNVYVMYGVAVVMSVLPTTVWATFLAIQADEYCWMVDTSWYQWIPDGFRIAVLAVNVLLLIDIMRSLLSKLRQNVTAQHTKYTYILVNNGLSYNLILGRACTSTLKAMSFLIPLFGIPFILTANRNIVDLNSCKAGDIYYFISYSIQALQSVMVAVLFCYFNKEVHTQIKGTYRKINLQFEDRFGRNDRRETAVRRETAATYVNHNIVTPKIDNVEINNFNKVTDWLSVNPVANQNHEENNKDLIPGDSLPEKDNAGFLFSRISKFIDEGEENLHFGKEGSVSYCNKENINRNQQ